jgi:hypothetical protein
MLFQTLLESCRTRDFLDSAMVGPLGGSAVVRAGCPPLQGLPVAERT